MCWLKHILHSEWLYMLYVYNRPIQFFSISFLVSSSRKQPCRNGRTGMTFFTLKQLTSLIPSTPHSPTPSCRLCTVCNNSWGGDWEQSSICLWSQCTLFYFLSCSRCFIARLRKRSPPRICPWHAPYWVWHLLAASITTVCGILLTIGEGKLDLYQQLQ